MYKSLRNRVVLMSMTEDGNWQEQSSRHASIFQKTNLTVWNKELLQGPKKEFVAILTPCAPDDQDFQHLQDAGVQVLEAPTGTLEQIQHYKSEEDMMEEWYYYLAR